MKQLVAIKRLTTIDEIEETAITGLKDINLTIDEGDFVAVLGDSDSGKSTLMYAISGMKKATTGSIVFNNRLLDRSPIKIDV